MALTTPAEYQTLKNDITITRASVVFEGKTLLEWFTGGADGVLARFYNQLASPPVLLWHPAVPTTRMLEVLDGAEFIGALIDNPRRVLWQVMTQRDVVNATLPQVRANFATIFGGGRGVNSLSALTALAQTPGTYAQALFSTPDGGAHVSQIFGQDLTDVDVSNARTV